MGQRGELFSTRVLLQNRTYFFNVKENRVGDLYLNIVESKNRDEGGFDRQSVILFADDLQEFLKGFDESLRVMEKEVRERRRSARPAAREDSKDGKHERGEKHRYSGAEDKHPDYPPKPRKKKPHVSGGTTDSRGTAEGRRQENRRPEGRRVVVKKK